MLTCSCNRSPTGLLFDFEKFVKMKKGYTVVE